MVQHTLEKPRLPQSGVFVFRSGLFAPMEGTLQVVGERMERKTSNKHVEGRWRPQVSEAVAPEAPMKVLRNKATEPGHRITFPQGASVACALSDATCFFSERL